MDFQKELVSIGMPTYAGGFPFLKRAIDSVLGQTYQNVELVITENPATDGTHLARALCEEYELRDKRVKYIRHKEDIGTTANYGAAFDHAHGEYFCWITSANFLDKYFIEKCVARLIRDKDAVMATSYAVHTNERGEVTYKLDPRDFVVSERDLYARLKKFILMSWGGGKAMSFHGLWRRAVLGNDPEAEFNEKLYSDMNFVFRRLAIGPFIFLPEVLFYKVILRGRESRENEKMSIPRFISAISRRIAKLVPTQLANTSFIAGIKTLSPASRIKLLFYNFLSAFRILTRRKY